MKPTSRATKAAKEISAYLAPTVTGSTEQIEQRIAEIIDKSTGLPELLEAWRPPALLAEFKIGEAMVESLAHRINILCSEAENARIEHRPQTQEKLDTRIDILKDQMEVWREVPHWLEHSP